MENNSTIELVKAQITRNNKQTVGKAHFSLEIRSSRSLILWDAPARRKKENKWIFFFGAEGQKWPSKRRHIA